MARILITGSNSGFGRLAALSLARNGHDVIATMRNPANASALLSEADGLSIEIRALDVCDAASVDAALHDAMTIDVVVNNAGYEVQSAVEQLSDEIFRRQLDTNVVGPMRCIRAVMPAWRRRGSGVRRRCAAHGHLPGWSASVRPSLGRPPACSGEFVPPRRTLVSSSCSRAVSSVGRAADS